MQITRSSVAFAIRIGRERPRDEGSDWVTPEACLFGYTLSGAGTGRLIGALIRSDVWAPTALATRRREQPPAPAPVSAAPVGTMSVSGVEHEF